MLSNGGQTDIRIWFPCCAIEYVLCQSDLYFSSSVSNLISTVCSYLAGENVIDVLLPQPVLLLVLLRGYPCGTPFNITMSVRLYACINLRTVQRILITFGKRYVVLLYRNCYAFAVGELSNETKVN
jgi:hypothetical protein